MKHPDGKAHAITRRQHGTISRGQALAVGLPRWAIDARRRNGTWLRVARGTYAIGGTPSSWEQRVMAAVLTSGPDAVVSHLSAAALWQLIDPRPTSIDVTVPHERRPRPSSIRSVHRTRVLTSADVTAVGTIPVTTPARTLVDLAAVLDPQRLEAVLDAAVSRRVMSIPRLRRYLATPWARTRRGTALLRRLVEDRERGTPESELERAFLRLAGRFSLPRPHRQFIIGRFRADFAYPGKRVAIELDGLATHRSKSDFQRDRRRQNALVLKGWLVLRFTWEDVTQRADSVVTAVRKALDAR